MLYYLLEELNKNTDIKVIDINTSGVRNNGFLGFIKFTRIFVRLVTILLKADIVSLHVATSSLPLWGFFVSALCRLFNKPFILRKFGGTDFFEYSKPYRVLAEIAVKFSNLYLVETQYLVSKTQAKGITNVRWFPNNRPLPSDNFTPRCACNRFIFLSQVKKTKGIFELKEAVIRLDGKAILHVYGPLFDEIKTSDINYGTHVEYMGEVTPQDVLAVLSKYDALVLPTYHEGEGYPGVIIEAYGVGLPVITTKWKNIPEIVDESVGILVEPRDVNQLESALELLVENAEFYRNLQANCQKKATEFSSKYWSGKFVEYCRELVQQH